MKKLTRLALAALLFAGCSHTKKNESKPTNELAAELQKLSAIVSLEPLKKPELVAKAKAVNLAVNAVPVGKLIGVSAASTDSYLGWVKTSVGFQKGEVTEAALQGLGLDLPYSWRVLKKYDDGSVRIGQLKTVGYFNGYGVVPVMLEWGKTPQAVFMWHPAVWDAVLQNRFQNNFKIQAIANGVAVDCYAAAGSWKFLVVDTTEVVVRFRSHCVNRVTLEPHALSMTSFWTLHSQDPVVRTTLVLGNDELSQPIQGGINVIGVTLSTGDLPQVRWVNEASYGMKSAQLGNGQTMAFKTVFTLDPAFNSTAQHIATGEPRGFQLWQDMVASNAFMTAPLPPTRIPVNQIQTVHAQVNADARFPNAQASDWLGSINQNPPSTGAQSDFASTMTLDVQKAAQAYSARQLAAVLLASYRESYRGSFLWDGAERFNVLTDPGLFCWSGSCPHYDWSWNNNQRIVWRARTTAAGFQGGSMSGWGTHDHQHVSFNTLRGIYELSGDSYIEDLLKYQLTMFAVGYFASPRWTNNLEADRAYGRSTKEAIAMTELFPDLPETAVLKTRIAAKQQAMANTVSQKLSQWGHMGAVLTDGCDPRVAFGCELQQQLGQGNIVNIAWQTGFVQEAELLNANPDLRWLQYSHELFLTDGTPKSAFLITDPNQYRTGGIGVEWWSGYVALAHKFPTAPGAQYVIEKLKPVLDARFQNGCGFPSQYFCLNDGWKSW